MMKVDMRFIFLALLILIVPASARNVIVFRGTATFKTVKNDAFAKLFEVDTVSREVLSREEDQRGYACDACFETSEKIEKVLHDPNFASQIGQVAVDVCKVLPSNHHEKCVEMSLAYIRETLLHLVEFFSADHLCYETDLCPKNDSSIELLKLHGDEVSNDKSCSACQNAVKKLQDDLENRENQIKVIRALLKVCENMEDHVQECKKIVFHYGPLILANIDKFLVNNNLCYIAHVCKSVSKDVENTRLIATS